MTNIDPGLDWRLVEEGEDLGDSDVLVLFGNGFQRRWVPKAPPLVLPTELYTVIRVTWKNRGEASAILTLTGKNEWLVAANITNYRNSAQLATEISDFKVVSVPVDSLVPEKNVETIYDTKTEQVRVVTIGSGYDKIVTTYKRTRPSEAEPWNAWELAL